MPQEVYAGEIELKVSILEAGGPDGISPFPKLQMLGKTETRKFETLVLENDWLIAAFIPDLGARLIELTDKASGVNVLAPELTFEACGPRGVHAFGGVEITLDGQPRINALGHVRSLVDEDGVWFAEAVAGAGLSYHLHVNLDEATLRFSLQIRNRTFQPVPWNPGLLWPRPLSISTTGTSATARAEDRDCGFAAIANGKRFAAPQEGGLTYFDEARDLAPRWGETLELTIVALAAPGQPLVVTPSAALTVTSEELILAPLRAIPGAKLVLLSQAEKTMEAPADLEPGTPLRYTLSELGGMPRAFAILDSDQNELLRFPPPAPPVRILPQPYIYANLPTDLESLAAEPATRYLGALLQTQSAIQKRDFGLAEQHAESALLFSGDDPLAWVEKAMAARLSEQGDSESPDLPNAHFLSPVEPLLRSESYLTQAGLDGKAFLAPFEASPNDLIEVACRYIELGLIEDAARFIDAARSVVKLPMLAFLYAYCCIKSGTLHTDAAAAIAEVTRLEPPFPWRLIERTALAELVKTFPNSNVLAAYLAIFDR